MSTAARAQPKRLDRRYTQAAKALLNSDPDTNLFLLSALSTYGLDAADGATWWGVGDESRLDAVTWLGRPCPDPGPETPAGLAVPWGEPVACQAIGEALLADGPPKLVIGPRQASDALWAGQGSPVARVWYDQRLYVCDQVRPGPMLALRPARPKEVDLMIEMSARMMAEDLGQDPRGEDAARHARRVRSRVLSGHCLVGLMDESVIFKVDQGSKTDIAVQVGGTWLQPEYRGQGLASAGMRSACTVLLRRHQRVTLHVNEANSPAIGAYRSAGFRPNAAFRLASR
ncbi:MAG: GNAT family N-acetyltransferase [Oligoflexia bacterium]|nr:GNAT family N-acetyltransferase [Oligoflexia bacterium]